MFKYYGFLLPPGIKGLTKNNLWKVKGIRKNNCSWYSKTYHMTSWRFSILRTPIFHSTVQLSQLPEASIKKCSLKIAVIKFKKNNERWITYNISQILVKYLWRTSLFVNMHAYSLQLYQKLNSFTVFSRILPTFYFFP